MMIDYNVSDHWSADTPDWLKSLVSSLDRRHGISTVLPLTVIVEEVLEWLELASGVDAWKNSASRVSLRQDLDESVGALGASLRAYIATSLTQFQIAFSRLINSPSPVLKQPPGSRTDAVWTDVGTAGKKLLEVLDDDEAARVCWDDLVATARDRTLEGREYRPIAELLFDQLRRRGLGAEWIFRDLVSVIAFGRDPQDPPIGQRDVPLEKRLANARSHVGTRAVAEPIVVWLGYQGRTPLNLSAGRVSFMNAHWAVPNAKPEGQSFEHKAELWELVQDGILFKVAELVDEKSDVDLLVRVDLGTTTAADAVVVPFASSTRSLMYPSTMLVGSARTSLSTASCAPARPVRGTSWSPGARRASPMITTVRASPHKRSRSTDRASLRHWPARICPGFSRPQSRCRPPPTTRSAATWRCAILPRQTSAVSSPSRIAWCNMSAYAALASSDLFGLLGERWPHARWLVDVRRAVHMCLLGGGNRSELVDALRHEWFANNPSHPWILFVADRSGDMLSLCRIESERAWIRRMFSSVSDHAEYHALIDCYATEGAVLEKRRSRVRNALVHGNPAGFAIVESVRGYAEFLSGSALNLALDSYIEGKAPATALAQRTAEEAALAVQLHFLLGRRAAVSLTGPAIVRGWSV
ncbi:hypothetical protein [Streptomyces sp. NPDC059597]|uniref:hypothetical protein n=1 Tax=Streptomyces sp. NPDC059597 TaxID=3346879 RepID=UPI0036A8A2D0